jgi:predicted Zn-ribbon and HTH transcriptional regulator
MPTRRESIILLLEEATNPLSVTEICAVLDIKNRALVYEDLKHIAKSVKAKARELIAAPASCGKCHYVIRENPLKKPSRCPKCKSEWIIAPTYIIREKKRK